MQALSDAKSAVPFVFPEWADQLAASDLPEPLRLGHATTLRWYLGYCRRHKLPTSFASARAFIAAVQRERQPEPAQVEQLRELMRFKHYSVRTEESYWNWIGPRRTGHGQRIDTSPRPSPF